MASGDVSVRWAGSQTLAELSKRINIPLTPTSPPGLVEANTVDPWRLSGKYALGWTYFCIVLVVLVAVTRAYHLWTDKIRQAMHKHEVEQYYQDIYSHDPEYAMTDLQTGQTAEELFPREPEKPINLTFGQSHWSSIGPVNDTLALFRWIFYRPVPEIKWKKRVLLNFPSLAVIAILVIATAFVTLYCFLPQPLYWQSIQFGSPPLAIRAGMISVAMTPWIIATSMKANLIAMITGIGHERLGVFHRWGGYLCLFLALVHTVPFYIQPVWDDGGMDVFQKLFPEGSGAVYGTGIACLVPLGWLCVGSLPFLRTIAYELFVALHIPVAMAYVALLFWHCHNYLTSWDYLWATVAIWVLSYFLRIFKLNWLKPWRNAWLIGDEAAITLMAENAIKVTIPTQMTWRPGQYVYLRMPGISIFESHPFTISSLCSEDFPSEYGDQYRDCTLVFRPFGGFTRRVLETAIEKGPFKTYRAYLEGPYGGMQRELAAFDTVVLFAGGSGITAIVSQLLNLIKRMRDGKAVTKKIEVVWTLKRLEAMDWFREELRICREFAPPDTVTCQFYVTASKRQTRVGMSDRAPRPISNMLHDKLDGFVSGIASKRTSAYIRDEAQGNIDREEELRAENQDAITSLPRAKHLQPKVIPPQPQTYFPPPPKKVMRENSLRKLEGRGKGPANTEPDSHEATRQFLSPSGSISKHREFHFPPPPPRADAPHFNFAPPSPRNSNNPYHPQNFQPSPRNSNNPYNPQNLPPPPGPPPQGYRPASYISHDSKSLSADYRPASYIADSKPASQDLKRPSQDHNGKPPSFEESTRPSHDSKSASNIPPPPPNPPIAAHNTVTPNYPAPPEAAHTRQKSVDLQIQIPNSAAAPAGAAAFDFGFPSTPTEFQKNLMRFAFVGPKKKEGWSTEYGRPDLGYMLKEMATGGADGKGVFGRRTCVFVCGPPSMRVDVANTVARLQADIWGDDSKDEVFLHTENYAI
ncbi:Ferredoxin reductase-like, C-terminal NADP-linked [Venustampulla echinocandica]|uniref:ferric-chelate reductase (NADPH) n=1 Tax=Venustampulla echinocandica TaxID=2656787 RepID=A0A370TZV6_9HELO|nr:Ferredoxin reductase-like, C-terminal NADP-linked [Venustampulla echinocandica]RDL41062.1 Ferredoxin reductase-like, C-terminal NADP-linked [Venustampulla echinocandica]